MKPWTDDIDPGTIPDHVLVSERARRNARKRKSYTGGILWKQHSATARACRCAQCTAKRKAAKALK